MKTLSKVVEFPIILFFLLGAIGLVALQVLREPEQNIFTRVTAFVISVLLSPFSFAIVTISWIDDAIEWCLKKFKRKKSDAKE